MLDPRNEMFMSIKKRHCYKIGGKICPDLATFIEKHCCCRVCYGIRPRLQLWNTCSMQCNWRFPRVGGYVADFCWLIIYGRQSCGSCLFFRKFCVKLYSTKSLFSAAARYVQYDWMQKKQTQRFIGWRVADLARDWLIQRARAEKQCNWLCRESKHDVLMAEESMLWHMIDW